MLFSNSLLHLFFLKSIALCTQYEIIEPIISIKYSIDLLKRVGFNDKSGADLGTKNPKMYALAKSIDRSG